MNSFLENLSHKLSRKSLLIYFAAFFALLSSHKVIFAEDFGSQAEVTSASAEHGLDSANDMESPSDQPEAVTALSQSNNANVSGCTDFPADNFNLDAVTDDGSCRYTVSGCTDVKSENFNPTATKNDGSCSESRRGEATSLN